MPQILLTLLSPYRNYLQLCKLPIVALMLVTAVVGMQLATPGLLSWQPMLLGCAGIGLIASSASCFNHLLDWRLDRLMQRTRHRPLPSGKLSPQRAFWFASLLVSLGFYILIAWVNVLTAVLALASLLGYTIVYTLFLKRTTSQNIVIGGLAGSTPPLLGWTSITNEIEPNSLLLVLIIFTWTPAHFWSLAIHRHQEYQYANIPMLPVTHGIEFTTYHILLYTILLSVISVLPFTSGLSGVFYLMVTFALNIGFLYWAIVLLRQKSIQIALKTFRYSNFYLLILFLGLLIDHYLIWNV
jgi:heme o synthase